MDDPLMNELERIVFTSTSPPSSPLPRFISGLNSNPPPLPPQSNRHAQTRFVMLVNFFSSSLFKSAPLLGEPSGASGPQGETIQPMTPRRSLDTTIFSLIEAPEDVLAQAVPQGLPIVLPTLAVSSLPRRLLARLFGGLGAPAPGWDLKGKDKRVSPDSEYPLDGDEGELVDEGCFVDVKECVGFDILSYLPCEIALLVFSHLDLAGIIACTTVSKTWRIMALDRQVWRELFVRRGWKVNLALAAKQQQSPPPMVASSSSISHRLSISFALPSITSSSSRRQSTISAYSLSMVKPVSVSSADPVAPLNLDWQALYKSRRDLETLWTNTAQKPRRKKLLGHTDSVYCLEFDSSLDVLITGSRDRTIKFWSLNTGELRQTLRDHHSGSVLCLKFSGAEGFMASGSSDKTLWIWQLHGLAGPGPITATRRKVLKGHSGGVLDLRIDANWIVSGSKDTVVRVWSRHTLELHCELSGHSGPVNSVGLEGNHVVSASGDCRMILWDLKTKTKVHMYQGHDRGLACVEFQGDYIISGSNDRTIKIWSVSRGECLATLAGHKLLVRALAFDVGLGRLISASYDESLKVWDFTVGSNGELSVKGVRTFKNQHANHIYDVKFDAGRIVSSGHDGKVVVLDFCGAEFDTSLFV